MARPKRKNVDYFPFICEEGNKMFFIEETYGNDGFATFVKILRELAKADDHYLDLSKRATLMYLSAKCKISQDLLLNIISDLVELTKFDKQLWNENRVIWCQDFIDNIQDAYTKRKNECITRKGLLLLLIGLGVRKPNKVHSKGGINPNKVAIKPHSIEEYTIEEDTIEENNNIIPKTSFGESVDAPIFEETKNGIDDVNANPVLTPTTKKVKNPKKAVPENVRVLRADIKKIFMDHYKIRFGSEFYWQVKDATSLIKIISQVQFKVKEKRPDETEMDQSTKDAFEFILLNLKDNFIINNFSIPMISSKFNEIYTEITNPNLIKHGKRQSTYDESAEYRRI